MDNHSNTALGDIQPLCTHQQTIKHQNYQCSVRISIHSLSIFICIAPNHKKVISRHFTHRAGSKPNSSGFILKRPNIPTSASTWQQCQEKIFNRKKPQAEPGSKWENICLDRLEQRRERGRIEERSTMKINNEASRSGTWSHPDVYRPRLPVRRESTDNSREGVQVIECINST